MISYKPLLRTLKRKNLHLYRFTAQSGLSRNFVTRIRQNMPMSTTTLDNFCRLLDCSVSDVIEYQREDGTAPLDQELFYLFLYAQKTNFIHWFKETEKGKVYNDCMINFRQLYQVYCLHHDIQFNDFITDECIKKEKKSEALPILEKLFQETKKNKTFPFVSWTKFKQFMITRG